MTIKGFLIFLICVFIYVLILNYIKNTNFCTISGGKMERPCFSFGKKK